MLYILLIAVGMMVIPWKGHTAYTVHQGKLLNTKEIATLSVQEHFSAATEAFENKDWEGVIHQATIVQKNFPSTPFAQETLFYLGVSHFQLGDLEKANKQLGNYLKRQTPLHFEEAIQCKFAIAEQYKGGKGKPLLGWKSMPRWLPAREEAIAIYDEVIGALPHHDLGAQALYGKAKLLFHEEDYKSSVETYQSVIRRFPKHPLSPESYIGIGSVYLQQAKVEYPDPDFLDLAEINFRKFNQEFPREGRLAIAEEMLDEMKEIYAQSFYEIGKFYEKTKKQQAAAIYFQQVMDTYPDTQVADLAGKRLIALKDKGVASPHEFPTDQVTAANARSPDASSDPKQPETPPEPPTNEELRRTFPEPLPQPKEPDVEMRRTIPGPLKEPEEPSTELKRTIPTPLKDPQKPTSELRRTIPSPLKEPKKSISENKRDIPIDEPEPEFEPEPQPDSEPDSQ